MQRWSALALVGILVACAALLFFRVGSAGPIAAPSAAASASASAAASASASGAPASSADVAPAGSAGMGLPDLAYEPDAPAPKAAEVAPSNLPEGAPKSVVFGVILVEYRGAQGATRGARAREAAEALAKDISEEAKKDFAAAVAKGDPGSMENAGSMPRGILEPAAEQVLFTLAVGDVGGPVDTPRGLWIVKRIE